MELCTARGISNLLYHNPPPLPIASNHIQCLSQFRAPFLVHLKQSCFSSGPRYTIISCLSSTTEATSYEAASPENTTTVATSPEDTTSEAAPPEEIRTEAASPEATSTEVTSVINDEPESNNVMAVEVIQSLLNEKEEEYINQPYEVPREDDSLQLLKFLGDLNIKFDYEDKYSILALSVGGLIALRIAAAVIGAIDSVPLLPKVLELVGLCYTIWFTTRFLIFEQNRDEFVAKVKRLKEEVIG